MDIDKKYMIINRDRIYAQCGTFARLLMFSVAMILPARAAAEIVTIPTTTENAHKILNQIKESIPVSVTTQNIIIGVGEVDLGGQDVSKGTLLLAGVSPFVRIPSDSKYVLISNTPSAESVANYLVPRFRSVRVGILRTGGKAQLDYVNTLRKVGSKSDLTIVDVEVKEGDTVGALRDLTKENIDLMLIIRDAEVYKNDNLRTVMEFLFRKRIPVISSIRGLLQAGAVAAITIEDEEISKKAAVIVTTLIGNSAPGQSSKSASQSSVSNGSYLDSVIYPDRVRIDVNEEASRFYGIGGLGEQSK